ncbi:MAG: hypothetical protein IPO77_21340 [Acidobacteria bacterium]|nr:hypothetical protein [Acidobacteriota bacterium]
MDMGLQAEPNVNDVCRDSSFHEGNTSHPNRSKAESGQRSMRDARELDTIIYGYYTETEDQLRWHIVLPEGEDDRRLIAASQIAEEGFAGVTIIGDEDKN